MASGEQEPRPSAAPDASELTRLQRAEAAYAAGDYRTLRAELDALRDAAQPEVKARAAELERATSRDPLFAVVVAACAAALFVVLVRYILR